MIHGGALDEARAIITNGWNKNRAIGATQLCAYLRGEISMDECVQNWITKTNQYAKRQRTWFRTQFLTTLYNDRFDNMNMHALIVCEFARSIINIFLFVSGHAFISFLPLFAFAACD